VVDVKKVFGFLFLFVLVFCSFVSASSFIVRSGVDYNRVSKIMNSVDLGDYNGYIDFVNYDSSRYSGLFTYNYFIFKDNSTKLSDYKITIYRSAYFFSDDKLECLVEHELGHFKDVMNGVRVNVLSEDYANKYGCNPYET
jgi:hypothetical protein